MVNIKSIPVLLATLVVAITTAPVSVRSQSGDNAAEHKYTWHDPDKIVTDRPCGECHQAEHRKWEETPHFEGFKTLHRKESAEQIAEAMGFRLIKRESLCLKCHYTATYERNQLKAVSGVSCESCHGAARDWIDIHNNYGGKDANFRTETAEHKTQRIAQAKEAGMLRPSELVDVAANCFQCHTVPEEKLVNVGGHSIGSSFELVSWVDKIRHNFLQAQFDPSATENVERSPERKRVMYVVGKALDLEFGIRGAANATASGKYLAGMQRRVRAASGAVQDLDARIKAPELQQMLVAARDAKVKPNNKKQLLAAADKIRQAARDLFANHDGAQWAALDPLVEGRDVPPPPTTGSPPATGTALSQRDTSGRGTPAQAAGTPSASSSPAASTAGLPPPKRKIRPVSEHETIGPNNCSCHRHAEQNNWLATDRHYTSIDPFFNQDPKRVKIARLYGLSPSQMTKGNQLCMDCHGTVISGQEHTDVFDGVSCESCHGGGKDFKEPHQEGDPAQGVNRSGYRKALQLGMRELRNVDVRADACAQCHYITEQRLLATGHPSGANFSFADGLSKIKHWPATAEDAATLTAAYQKVLASRGPVPQVTQISSVSSGSGTSSPSSSPGQQASQRTSSGSSSQSSGPASAGSQPSSRGVIRTVGTISLPEFPVITDTTSIEDAMIKLKKRLELLYRKINEKEQS